MLSFLIQSIVLLRPFMLNAESLYSVSLALSVTIQPCRVRIDLPSVSMVTAGNTKGSSITVALTSCLTGLE
jgi:hypothetical protein